MYAYSKAFGLFFSVCLAVWLSVTPASAVSCKDWNTKEFFKIASAADVSACLLEGVLVNTWNIDASTPLHKAAKYSNDPKVIITLVNAGADINATTHRTTNRRRGSKKGEREETPLHFAAEFNKNSEVIATLLTLGANVNARDVYEETPLHYAAEDNKNARVITILVTAGADPNARDHKGETPLHDATEFNKNPKVITALVAAGADPWAQDTSGTTPLQVAKRRNPLLFAAFTADTVAAFKKKGMKARVTTQRSKKKARRTKSVTRKIGMEKSLQVAQVSCEQWNTSGFFRNATGKDVSRCLKRGADPNVRNKYGEAPLHYAARNENLNVITALLDSGANVNARDNSGATPLHFAAKGNKNSVVIAALLKGGANVNTYQTKMSPSYTSLHLAAMYNENPAIVTVLINNGAKVNAYPKQNWSITPLGLAAQYNKNPKVITALLAAGADPDLRNQRETPLELARKRKYSSEFVAAFSEEAVVAFKEKERKARNTARKRRIKERLRMARVSCDKWNTSSFFRNASAADVSRCLKTKNPNARSKYDETPLHLAAKFTQKPAVVIALKKAGGSLKAWDEKGRTPLHTAAVFGKTPEVVTALINAGADLSAKDKRGRTPLRYAEKFSKTPAVVAVLRKAFAPKKTKVVARKEKAESRPGTAGVSCEQWNTPAFFKSVSLADIFHCLKTKSANARNNNGRTPMHYAAQGDAPAHVAALANAGADPNAPDSRGGWTPLHLAAWFGKTPAVVAALLSAGADPAARDKAGKTPWDYAEQNPALKDTPSYWRLNEERVK